MGALELIGCIALVFGVAIALIAIAIEHMAIEEQEGWKDE